MKKNLVVALVLALAIAVVSQSRVDANTNWCPEWLENSAFGVCVSDQITAANLPYPVNGWSPIDPPVGNEKVLVQYKVIASSSQWDYYYPGTTAPIGFPVEKWFVIEEIHVPAELVFLGANMSNPYDMIPFTWFDQRVVDSTTYYSRVCVGFGVRISESGDKLPIDKFFSWEIPAYTIPGIENLILNNSCVSIDSYDPGDPVPWAD